MAITTSNFVYAKKYYNLFLSLPTYTPVVPYKFLGVGPRASLCVSSVGTLPSVSGTFTKLRQQGKVSIYCHAWTFCKL
ncbi:hypothetical protein FRX31_014252 [Thalictrum thalictroides]|uniref:Uncharacterized protein n=1 Tax=Thalictrum thalictroides TaxID=46969 RepID=A0A7J6WFK3_THATH|nr:hypothetical protein FRX31_014252 [Thalictrum thalictroides]